MKLSNTAIKELSAKYRSILQKCAFLNAIILGVAFSTVVQAAGIDIVIDGTTEKTTGYSDTSYVGVDGTIADLGNNVNSIETIGGISSDVYGIKVENASITATSIADGINLTTTEGEVSGIYAEYCTTNVKGLGDISTTGQSSTAILSGADSTTNIEFTNGKGIVSTGTSSAEGLQLFGETDTIKNLGYITVTAPDATSGISTNGIVTDNSHTITFSNGTNTITTTSSNGSAKGINANGASKTIIENLAGITASGLTTTYGIYDVSPTIFINDDLNFSNTVKFSNNGIIKSTINSTSSSGIAYGIYAERAGTTTVTGLDSIIANGNEQSYGIYSSGTEGSGNRKFVNSVTFANNGTIKSSSSSNEAHGIRASGKGATTINGLKKITVEGESAYGIYSYNDTGDENFSNNVTFANGGTITATSSSDEAYGIYAIGTGETTVTNLASITTEGPYAFGIRSEGDDSSFSNSITFINEGTINTTSTSLEAAYGILAQGNGTTTVSAQGGGATIDVSVNDGSSKVTVEANATLNLNGFNLTNTSGVNTISANASDGDTPTLNLTNTTVAGSIYTGTVSEAGTFNMNVGMGASLKFNDINFVTTGQTGTFNLNITGGAIDLRNNAISATTLPSFLTFKTGTSHIYADVDLASETMDTLSQGDATLESGAQINVSKLNLLSDATKQSTTITFTTDEDLISAITDWETGISYSYSPKYIYDVTYDNGEFTFTQHTNEVNPSLYASSTVSQTVGLLQSDIINVAFDGLNAGNSAKFSEKTGDDTPKDNAWVKVIGVDDNVDFDSFKTVDSEMFSLMAGMNTKDIKVGSADMKFGFYSGYLNGEQKYTDNQIEQDGGYLGLSTSWTKGNIVLNGTINGGFMNNEAENTFGTDKYDTFWTGVGIKAGYNYDLGSALTLQPNVYAGYTLVDTEDYTSKSGVRIKNDKTHLFEVAPGFKLSKDFQNYWKGYAQVKYAVLADKGGDVNADDLALSNISADNYAEYGIGLKKAFANAWGMNMTINRRDGGRQGWNGSVEMKYNF